MMNPRCPIRWAEAIGAIAAAICLASLVACAGPEHAVGPERTERDRSDAAPERLTVHDLEGVDLSQVPPSEALTAPRIDQRLIVQRLAFEQDAPRLRLAMSMADDHGIDPEQRELWRANGLGIGRVRRERLGLFVGNLPQPLTADTYRIHNASTYTPLTLISRTAAGERVRLAERGGGLRIVEPGLGEYRMLLKLAPAEGPGAMLTMRPHHNRRGRDLLPRSRDERLSEDTPFDHLRIDQEIEPGLVWVIWADLPPPAGEAAENAEAGAGDGQAGEAAEPPAEGHDRELRLGEAMLRGDRRGRPVQIVILLGIL